ncbi:MAG: DUF1080 domain-containing protein [Planctomycetota bacterium]
MRSGVTTLAAVAATALLGWANARAAVAGGADGSSDASAAARARGERVRLFDGETLEGWTTKGGRYDGDARWSVEDGALTGRTGEGGEGGLIYTTRSFTSFDLELECKLDYPYDSGVFVRMLPPDSGLKGAQVTLDHREGGEIAAIYADGFLEHNTEAEAKFRKNDWNRVRVRCTGFDPRIQVWINGEPVTDYRLPAGTPGFATRGLIGLQVHPADAEAAKRRVQFRNILVEELDVFASVDFDGAERTTKPNAGALHRALGGTSRGNDAEVAEAREGLPEGNVALTSVARDAGWRDLFEHGLDDWVAIGAQEGYGFANGVLTIPDSGGGHIVTKDDFRDFRLRLDFKIAEMANSGLFLRGKRDGSDPAYSGCEIQIIDDFHWEERTNSQLRPYQFTGSLYAAQPAGPDKEYRPPGEWNRYEVLCRGTRIAAALNGRLLFDVDTSKLEANPPFTERAATGFIGLQRHSDPEAVPGDTSVWVRNVFVQPLQPVAPDGAKGER